MRLVWRRTGGLGGHPSAEQHYSAERSAKAWAPQSTTKGLVQASERAQGQGEGDMKGETVEKIISIEKKLLLMQSSDSYRRRSTSNTK